MNATDMIAVRRSSREFCRTAEKQLAATLEQRDRAMGPDARTAAERRAEELQEEIDGFEAEIRRLQAREDDDYEKWRRRAHDRRYAAPSSERILEVDFVLA